MHTSGDQKTVGLRIIFEKLKIIFRKEKDMGKAKYTRDKQG